MVVETVKSIQAEIKYPITCSSRAARPPFVGLLIASTYLSRSPLTHSRSRDQSPATRCDESAKCVSQIRHSWLVTLSPSTALATRQLVVRSAPLPDEEGQAYRVPLLAAPSSPSRSLPPAPAQTTPSTRTDGTQHAPVQEPPALLSTPTTSTYTSPSPPRVAHCLR